MDSYSENYQFQNVNESRMAYAEMIGGPLAPQLHGMVTFRDLAAGTEICIEVSGLPAYESAQNGKSPIGPHGFHIHEHGVCQVGDPASPFASTDGHWNPTNQPHGNHVGDFPVLFSNNGYSQMCFFTNKFHIQDVIGRSVVIHQNPDDYRTQPSGNSGKMLACGVIKLSTQGGRW